VPKRILMIAFHYPPILHSSGVHRTAKFVQYLPEYGWMPDVLTVSPRVYPESSPEIPTPIAGTSVTRAFSLDTARHLSIGGRYFKFMAIPDRWVSWLIGAVPAGLRIIKKQTPQLIWSTYPIATAHLIGYALHKITKLPWIADFRDPMTDTDYPSDPKLKRIYQHIERKTLKHCTLAVFTTADSRNRYQERFPDITANKFHVIPNGFDEETFSRIEQQMAQQTPAPKSPCLYFVHSGILYPSERNPLPFFDAIAELKQAGQLTADKLKIALRASGNEAKYQQKLVDLKIDDIISLESSLPYDKALTEMMSADGLLLFQAANCNHQIPAKAYEYMRAKKPVFALTDHNGNTAQLLKSSGIDTIVDIAKKEEIKTELLQFIDRVLTQTAPITTDDILSSYSRQTRTRELAKLLDTINI